MATKRIIAHYMPETEQGEDLRQLSSLQDSCACVIRDGIAAREGETRRSAMTGVSGSGSPF